MLLLGIISLIVLVILIALATRYVYKTKRDYIWKGFGIGIVFSGFLLIAVFSFLEYNNPTPIALDVYRGKTELKITYEQIDSVLTPIDSTVIFKSKL